MASELDYKSTDDMRKRLTSPSESAIVDKSSQETDTGQSATLKPGVGSGAALPPISGEVASSDPTRLLKQVESLTPVQKAQAELDKYTANDPYLTALNKLQRAQEDELRKEAADLRETTKAAIQANKWAEVGERIAHAVAQFAAAQYGLKHGVDMSGLKFDKTDWQSYRQEAQQNMKTLLEDIGSRRALMYRDIMDQRGDAMNRAKAAAKSEEPTKLVSKEEERYDAKTRTKMKRTVWADPTSGETKKEGPWRPVDVKDPERPVATKAAPVTDLTSKINNTNKDISAVEKAYYSKDDKEVEDIARGVIGDAVVEAADKKTWTRSGMNEELKKALGAKLQELRQQRAAYEEEIRRRQQGQPQAEQPTPQGEENLIPRKTADGTTWLFDAVTKKAVRQVK